MKIIGRRFLQMYKKVVFSYGLMTAGGFSPAFFGKSGVEFAGMAGMTDEESFKFLVMIKNIFFYTVCLLLMLSGCTSKTNVSIVGDIKNADRQKVYLEQLNVDNRVVVDSAETNKNGHFRFKIRVDGPTFYNVKVGPKEFITFVASPEEQIELSGTLEDLSRNYWVDGSENSLWIKLLNFQLDHTRTAMDSLEKAFKALPGEESYAARRQEITAAWDSVVNKQMRFSRDFILKHAVSPASYYALYQKWGDEFFILEPVNDLQSYKIVASSMKAMFPESQYTQALLKHLDEINKELRNEQIRQLIANSENTLPEIRLPGVKGDTVSLRSLKNKLIVLDFTVLSAKDAPAYIAQLKTVYDKFRNRGVQFYQVCLDPNKLLWEKLVKEYGIDWICVWDRQGLQSQAAKSWNIQSVPADYILNSKSEIVGKNLYGKRLEDRLNDLLK